MYRCKPHAREQIEDACGNWHKIPLDGANILRKINDMHRILVVEDMEDTRAILRAVLTHRGFEMLEAESAEEMLEKVEVLQPDLIVLDIRLPGMDGCEALPHLRAAGYGGPVFLFSEYQDLFSEKVQSCKPDALFPKSKGPVALVDAIAQRLSLPA